MNAKAISSVNKGGTS